MATIFTIGHSTQSLEAFLAALAANGIDAIADVRSEPFSGRYPEYNREALRDSLAERSIAYVFLGRELGARPRDDAMYSGERVSYELLGNTPRFREGLARVIDGAARFRLALLCSEGDPLNCHRSLLVGRHLVEAGHEVVHLHPGGRQETQADAMERLLEIHRLPPRDVFGGRTELVDLASARQEGRIAFRRTKTPLDRV